MRPDSLTVWQLFDKQQRYIVPLFQRQYVWAERDEWQPLWEDISAKADETILKQDDNQREPGNHFLGAIVLNHIRTTGKQVSAKTIIDGQQRLTTLQIILYALRDYLRNNQLSDRLRDLEIITENSGTMEESYERFKVWPTNADRPIYQSLFEAGSPDELQARYPKVRKKYKRKYEPNPRLVDAYLFFYRSIEAYLMATDEEDPLDDDQLKDLVVVRIDALLEAFKFYLEIVTIDLNEQDNPQVIFETLNYRGVPLLPSDLIRNFVFLEATRKKENVEHLYTQYWSKYDERPGGKPGFWKQQERQGRLKRERLDLFVNHYLVFQTEQEIYISRLYQEFRDWWNGENGRVVETVLQQLEHYGKVFKTFYQPPDESRISMFKRRLRRLDITTVYPLLLFLFGEKGHELDAQGLAGMAVDIESFLVRRQVCGLTTKNYNNVFLSLLKNLRKSEHVTRERLQELLMEPNANSARWPDDDEFKAAWLSNPLYRSIGSGRTRMILEALDLQYMTRKQEKVHLSGSLTVEHVMPGSWKSVPEAWPLQPNDDKNEELATAERDQMIHTIGNLTLLTNSLNPAVSNSAFEIKRPAIVQHSALRLNAYFQTVNDPNVWNEAAIVKRGEKLFETAIQVWPHPG